MSNPWQVLGLERGADRVEIRRAYARMLKQTNPEDDPKGFMELRQAYEWLLDHIEYQTADFDEYRIEPAQFPAHAAAEDLPVRESVSANPWASSVEEDPDEIAMERELDELEAHLASGGNEGRQHSRELVAQILAHPALAKLSIANMAEHRLAHMIIQNPPYSDAIILQSVDAFGWMDQRRAHQFPFSGVIARLDEWRLIQSLERPDDSLHKAWRLLTDQASAPVRWWNARMGRREQVAELLDYAEYSAPGLIHSMDSDAAAWWREELQQRRLPIEPILWQLAGSAILYFTLIALKLTVGQAALIAGGVFATAAADMLLARTVLAKLQWRHRPSWQYAAPILAMLAVPPILLFVPLTWTVAIIVVVVILAIVWAARLLLFDPTGVPLERRWAALLGLSAIAFLIGSADQPIPLAHLAVLVAVAWMLQMNLPMLRPAAGAVIDRITRDWAWPVLMLYGVGMLVAVWATEAHGQAPLVRVGIAVLALYAAGGIAPFTVRSIPPFILGIMLVAGSLSLLGAQAQMDVPDITESSSPGELLYSLHGVGEDKLLEGPQREALDVMTEMMRRNPATYARIDEMIAQPMGAKQGASIDRIDKLINSEIERLMSLSSNTLIAEHQRLKADIAIMLRKNDVTTCGKHGFALNSKSDPKLRERLRKSQLAIVAHGPADPIERADTQLPLARDFDARRAAFLKEAQAQPAPGAVDRALVDACNSRVATARALAELSDDQLGTLARSTKDSKPSPSVPIS